MLSVGALLAVVPCARADSEASGVDVTIVRSLEAAAATDGSPFVIGSPSQDMTIARGSRIRVIFPGVLELHARKLVVEPDVLVDASGAPGQPGRNGPSGKVEWVSSAEDGVDAHTLWVEAVQAQLNRDVDGERGAPGKPGATVRIIAQEIEGAENLTVDVSGGLGGAGGRGGPGRVLRCGAIERIDGKKVPHNHSAIEGLPGRPGVDGEAGPTAKLEISPTEAVPKIRIVNRQPARTDDYALVVSGGTSLGSYEAGYNWAFLRVLKASRAPDVHSGAASTSAIEASPGRPNSSLRLVGIAGASAGSINSLLSAITWCQAAAWDSAESPTENLFWDTWVDIGWEQLFPYGDQQSGDGTEGFGADDGILSRAAFQTVKKRVLERANGTADGPSGNRFIPGCTLKLGMSLTRKIPVPSSEVDSRAVPRARFLAVTEAVGHPAELEFRRLPASRLGAPGDYLQFEAAQDGRVAAERVVDGLETSAAIPWVFGAKTLPMCEEIVLADGNPSFRCPPPGSEGPEFIDGGVFDNLPIGLALAFRPPPTPAGGATAFHVMALDPGRRRSLLPSATAAGTPKRGLASIKQMASAFVSVSRKYELKVLFDTPALRLADHRLEYSSRFAPVMGEQFGAFGAFLLKPFREFDYHVGVYDALFDLAHRSCRRGEPSDTQLATCLVTDIAARMRELQVTGDGAFVVKRLLGRELQCMVSSPGRLAAALSRAKFSPSGTSYQSWLDEPGTTSPAVQSLTALAVADINGKPGACTVTDDGQRLQRAAAAVAVSGAPLTPREREFATNPALFGLDAGARVVDRAWNLEHADESKAGKRVADGGLFAIETYRRVEGMGVQTSAGTARSWGRLLPYYAATGRITEVGWRPLHVATDAVGFGVPLFLRWSDARPAGSSFGAGAGLSLVVPLAKLNNREIFLLSSIAPWGITAFEISANGTWNEFDRRGVRGGGEIAAYVFAGKLRIAYGRTDLWRASREVEPDIARTASGSYVTVGIADLNGILYWGLRALAEKGK